MTTQSSKTNVEKLMNIDPRIIYTTVFIIIGITVLFPLAVPAPPTEHTIAVYEWINTNVRAGDNILIDYSISPSNYVEMGYGSAAFAVQCFQKGAHVIFTALIADSPPLLLNKWPVDIQPLLDKYNLKPVYGVDYAILGYVAGNEVGVASMATDMWKAFGSKDYYGTAFSKLTIMASIHTQYDLKFVLAGGGSTANVEYFIRQMPVPPKSSFATGSTTSDLYPYYPGQLLGVLGPGLTRSAEYETLVGYAGGGHIWMFASTLIYGELFILLILGNVLFWYGLMKKRYSSRRISGMKV